MKQNELKFVNTNSSKELGSIWWDGKKIQMSSPHMKVYLQDIYPNGLSMSDGLEYLEALPSYINRLGYMSVKRV